VGYEEIQKIKNVYFERKIYFSPKEVIYPIIERLVAIET